MHFDGVLHRGFAASLDVEKISDQRFSVERVVDLDKGKIFLVEPEPIVILPLGLREICHLSLRRLGRVHPDTVGELKAYFRRMWIIDESMEKHAVAELARLSKNPRIVENITNFVNNGVVPWEK